jgi:hypothetical protein
VTTTLDIPLDALAEAAAEAAEAAEIKARRGRIRPAALLKRPPGSSQHKTVLRGAQYGLGGRKGRLASARTAARRKLGG